MSRQAPIRPEADGLAAVFWDAVQQERLLVQCCTSCERCRHPPSEFCPSCGSSTFEWTQASGEGIIYSFTVIHHAAHAAVADWLPYTVVLVDLSEGPRVVGRLLDPPAEPAIGASVRLEFERYADLTVPAFVLSGRERG